MGRMLQRKKQARGWRKRCQARFWMGRWGKTEEREKRVSGRNENDFKPWEPDEPGSLPVVTSSLGDPFATYK